VTRVTRLLLLALAVGVLQVGYAQEPPETSRLRDPKDGQFDERVVAAVTLNAPAALAKQPRPG
jgi:hypothetical protein